MPIVQGIACVLLADFLSGLFHWLEDAYGHEDLPLLGNLVTRRNNLHHQDPSYFAQFSYWHSSWFLIALCSVVGVGALLAGVFSWQLALVLVLGANANQVHKWTHRSRKTNGRLVSWLMDARLIASQRHHASHHTGSEQSHYCVLTPHLNPVLDRLGFWKGLESAIERVFGVKRRDPRLGSLPAGIVLRKGSRARRQGRPDPAASMGGPNRAGRTGRRSAARATERRSSRRPGPAAVRSGSS